MRARARKCERRARKARLDLDKVRDEAERRERARGACRRARCGEASAPGSEASRAGLESDLSHANGCLGKRDAELASARTRCERLDGELREALSAKRAAGRAALHARSGASSVRLVSSPLLPQLCSRPQPTLTPLSRPHLRPGRLPEAVRILQTRLTDSLLRPLEEVVRSSSLEISQRPWSGRSTRRAPCRA